MNKEVVITYLISNQEHLKELIKPHRESMTQFLSKEDHCFSTVIKQQYNEKIESVIVEELSRSLGLDCETGHVILGDINLEDYFNV